MNKIAIHRRIGSFSDRWIEYCLQHNINFKIVNCYKNDILEQLSDCDGLMWHWQHNDSKAILFAKELIYLIESSGKKVFPNTATLWHFDDKISQKYLFESIGAPFPVTKIFYDLDEALGWTRKATFPKVFKLRRGAGSSNVFLVKNKAAAQKIVRRAFSKGLFSINKRANLYDKFYRLRNNFRIIDGLRFLYRSAKIIHEDCGVLEKGYVIFQDYIDSKGFDIRTVVIGSKCVAIKRLCRENDFRASGSGQIIHNHEEINPEVIKISFELKRVMKAQVAAFDFILTPEGIPYVLEVSYSFAISPYDQCDGHWDWKIQWHPEKLNLQNLMMEDFLSNN